MVHDGKIVRKVKEQIVARHGTSGEEIIAHPTLIKVITKVLVGKNVNKQMPRRLEERVDLVQQVIVILHVLKHFDGHDQIVVPDDCQGTLVVGNVTLCCCEWCVRMTFTHIRY